MKYRVGDLVEINSRGKIKEVGSKDYTTKFDNREWIVYRITYENKLEYCFINPENDDEIFWGSEDYVCKVIKSTIYPTLFKVRDLVCTTSGIGILDIINLSKNKLSYRVNFGGNYKWMSVEDIIKTSNIITIFKLKNEI